MEKQQKESLSTKLYLLLLDLENLNSVAKISTANATSFRDRLPEEFQSEIINLENIFCLLSRITDGMSKELSQICYEAEQSERKEQNNGSKKPYYRKVQPKQ